jgi:hypothetical protein
MILTKKKFTNLPLMKMRKLSEKFKKNNSFSKRRRGRRNYVYQEYLRHWQERFPILLREDFVYLAFDSVPCNNN